jgi:hypothetical protein
METETRIRTEASGDGRRPESLRTVIERIVDDLKTIGTDEMMLARTELSENVKKTTADTAAIVLGGIVALIGLAMLCTALVVALAPLIPALWLRLVLCAALFLLVGGVVAALFSKRLKRDATPELRRTRREAKRTVRAVREVRHA